jgi:hypothetical protein
VVTDAVGTPVWVIGVTSFSSRSDTRTLRGPAARGGRRAAAGVVGRSRGRAWPRLEFPAG